MNSSHCIEIHINFSFSYNIANLSHIILPNILLLSIHVSPEYEVFQIQRAESNGRPEKTLRILIPFPSRRPARHMKKAWKETSNRSFRILDAMKEILIVGYHQRCEISCYIAASDMRTNKRYLSWRKNWFWKCYYFIDVVLASWFKIWMFEHSKVMIF